ncbi:MAG: hypothetical protein ACREJR_07785 [Candidatus Rokuibacteriota bacterium]
MSIPGVAEIGRPARRLGLAVLILTAAVGCATPAPIEVPAELPLVTNDQLFEFRWALQREAARTRAVGRVRSSSETEFRLTLDLYGIDAGGRIVSRGRTYVRSDFDRQAMPFSVETRPTGQETRYELRVIESYVTGIRPD